MRIKDSSGNILTSRFIKALPRKDAIKIESRLLDGSFHYQTIGLPGTVVELQFIINTEGKEVIDEHESINAPIRVETKDKYYIGSIRQAPVWEIFLRGNVQNRIYRGSLIITVTEEGVL